MTAPDYDHIPRDETGRYRSAKLPSMRGAFIQLPPKLIEPGADTLWQQRLAHPQSLITLDLFAGAGGMSLGFEDAGFFVAAGVDQERWATMSHGYNLTSKSVQRDICDIVEPQAFLEEIGLPRVDVLIGGPPCQGFATIGRGKLRSLNLEEHYRTILNSLYTEFVRFVEILRPLVFVMENVPDMGNYEGGELLQRIKQSFPEEYIVDSCVLNAVDYAIPQRRKRLFIQGNRMKKPIVWPKPTATTKYITVRDAIGDLPVRTPPSLDEILPYTSNELTLYQSQMRARLPKEHQHIVWDHIIRQVREDDKMIFAMLPEGGKYRDLPEEWRRYRSDIFDDKYWKLIYDQPAWTVTAHIRKDAYRYIHPDKEQGRTLSIREFARLQSFPDHFRFCGPRTERLRQIGNAVPPLLAQCIAEQLYSQIQEWRAFQTTNGVEEMRAVNTTLL